MYGWSDVGWGGDGGGGKGEETDESVTRHSIMKITCECEVSERFLRSTFEYSLQVN